MNSELIRTHAIVSSGNEPGGPDSAGQCGDTQGLAGTAEGDSESVEELLEEGQSFEAEAILGLQNTPDADVAEVHTKQVREDDVPAEYLEKD